MDLVPPELVSRGRPYVGRELRKTTYAAVMKLREGRRCEACPASSIVSVDAKGLGLTVRCAVERNLISERKDPSTLLNRCLSDPGYQACSTWRSEKERIWAGQPPLVGASEGV